MAKIAEPTSESTEPSETTGSAGAKSAPKTGIRIRVARPVKPPAPEAVRQPSLADRIAGARAAGAPPSEAPPARSTAAASVEVRPGRRTAATPPIETPAAADSSADGASKARRRARNPLRWVRYLLLAAGVAVVCGVAVLILAYSFGRVADAPEPRTSEHEDPSQLLVGTGFEYTQTGENAVPIFRIRAEHSRQELDETAHLDKVLLEIYRADGANYTITSDRATFNEDRRQARLEGHVVLEGLDDFQLEARALELHQEGQLLTSDGAVEFRYPPEFEGRASGLRFDRRVDTIQLLGGVHIRTIQGAEEPVRLDCERVAYQRRSGLIRAFGDVVLERPGERIESRYLTVFMAEEGGGVEGVRARWEVRGHLEKENDDGSLLRIVFQGHELEVQPRPGRTTEDVVHRKVTLISGEGVTARLRVLDGTGMARELDGAFLVGEIRDARLVEVSGTGRPLTLTESLDLGQPWLLRRACAEQLRVRFLPGGKISQAVLESQVELYDPPLTLSGGSEATVDLQAGEMQIHGTAVELYTDRLKVIAPRFAYARDNGLLRASEGVQTTLVEGALGGFDRTPLGHGSGPIQVQSEEAIWTEKPGGFSFLGGVRAWRGANLLLADQVRGEESRRELTASGQLKTVWVPDSTSDSGMLSGRPVEVTADTMVYLEPERRLVYDGGVKMAQDRRTLACQNLSVDLSGPNHDAEQMVCDRRVKLVDPEAGRRVEGDRAVYTVSRDLVEVSGEEVLLFDADDNQIRGRYLLYDLDAGTVSLKSRAPEAPAAAETAAPDAAGPATDPSR